MTVARLLRHVGVVALLAASAAVGAWTPPSDPDPVLILKEARRDARDGRLAEAAAKHRWYHDHVLGLVPSHSGVRLSFALSDWYTLAQRYEPARRDFLAARDAAARQVASGGARAVHAFGDVATMNERLQDWSHTRDVFAQLASRSPQVALSVADEALPALVQTEDFALAAPYLDVERRQQRLSRLLATLVEPRPGAEAVDAAQRASGVQFIDHQTAPMVFALVRLGRVDEARACVTRLKGSVGNLGVTPISEAALQGQKPPGSLY